MGVRLVAVIAVVTLPWTLVVGANWARGDRYRGFTIPDWVPTTSLPSAAVTDYVRCVTSCLENGTCTGVYVEHGTTCKHFYVDNFEFWTSGDPTLEFVFVAPMKVVLVSSGPTFAFTYQDANNACKDLRGRLITLAEMASLWASGYEKCSCGWVDDGAGGTNAQPDHGTCGNPPQVFDCAIPLGHAYCVLN